MARQRPLPKRPTRSRIQTYIPGEVHELVDLYCAHYGLTEAKFFETAAAEKLKGAGDAKRLARSLNIGNQQLEIASEMLSEFVRMWFHHTPPLPAADLERTGRQAEASYQMLLQRITTNLSGGRGFFDALAETSHASKAAGVERITAATTPSTVARAVR